MYEIVSDEKRGKKLCHVRVLWMVADSNTAADKSTEMSKTGTIIDIS